MRSVELSVSLSNRASMMPGIAAFACDIAVELDRSKLETNEGPRRAVSSVSMTLPAAPAARARRGKSIVCGCEVVVRWLYRRCCVRMDASIVFWNRARTPRLSYIFVFNHGKLPRYSITVRHLPCLTNSAPFPSVVNELSFMASAAPPLQSHYRVLPRRTIHQIESLGAVTLCPEN